tara:strand:- start:466 stop:636 length:171 start_codon:yes stop_codon:yes gene_type:complete
LIHQFIPAASEGRGLLPARVERCAGLNRWLFGDAFGFMSGVFVVYNGYPVLVIDGF